MTLIDQIQSIREERDRLKDELIVAMKERNDATMARDRLKEHWTCNEHGEFGSHQWGCPDCVSDQRREISRLHDSLAKWHLTALETAALRGVLIEFWEATAKGEPNRVEAARMALMSTAGHLVARKEKGELV